MVDKQTWAKLTQHLDNHNDSHNLADNNNSIYKLALNNNYNIVVKGLCHNKPKFAATSNFLLAEVELDTWHWHQTQNWNMHISC